jgi:hypothetical protein
MYRVFILRRRRNKFIIIPHKMWLHIYSTYMVFLRALVEWRFSEVEEQTSTSWHATDSVYRRKFLKYWRNYPTRWTSVACGSVVDKALRYDSDDPGIDSRWCHWIFQWCISIRPYHGAWVDSAPCENEYQEHSWGKGGRWVRWQTHHLHVPNVMKSGSLNLLEPSGPHRARYGAPLPFRWTSNSGRNCWETWTQPRFCAYIHSQGLAIHEFLSGLRQENNHKTQFCITKNADPQTANKTHDIIPDLIFGISLQSGARF